MFSLYIGFALLQSTTVAQLYLTPTTIEQADPMSCSSLEERELILRNVANTVRYLLQKILADMDRKQVPACGEGKWHLVAHVNMSDPMQQCPTTWREYSAPARACGRPEGGRGCASHTFSVDGIEYSKVCGRIIAYQYANPDAFHSRSIDDFYIDGISMTHGMPRNHIWSFASSLYRRSSGCPCSSSSAFLPAFVGDHYFCESGNTRDQDLNDYIFTEDLLWDGEECINQESCCMSSIPWFSIDLPSSTANDIEVRICADEGTSNEDTPIKLLDIYIQ